MNRLGLELLTVLGMPPVEHVVLAAELGCVSISTGLSGLPLAQLGYPNFSPYHTWLLEDDSVLRREVKATLRDTGVHIGLAEGFRVRPDADLRDRAAALDIVAALGALRVNAVSMELDMARAHDQLAVLAEMVNERGMKFIFEFAPPNAINTPSSAIAAADHVGRDRYQIMFDSIGGDHRGRWLEVETDAAAICRENQCGEVRSDRVTGTGGRDRGRYSSTIFLTRR